MPESSSINKTIIIVAQYFNPSIFRESWLLSQRYISSPSEISEKSIFSPQIAQIVMKDLEFVVTPDQIQFSLINEINAISVIRSIVETLPHVPYKAIGINFDYFIPLVDNFNNDNSRKLYYNKNNNIYDEFNNHSARFGAYLSTDFNNCRLKVDIKPIKAVSADKELREYLHHSFNFHKDYSDQQSVKGICDMLDLWNEFFTKAESLMSVISKSL